MGAILLRRKSGTRRSMSDLLLLMGFIVVPLSLCVGELVTPALADFLDHCPKDCHYQHLVASQVPDIHDMWAFLSSQPWCCCWHSLLDRWISYKQPQQINVQNILKLVWKTNLLKASSISLSLPHPQRQRHNWTIHFFTKVGFCLTDASRLLQLDTEPDHLCDDQPRF